MNLTLKTLSIAVLSASCTFTLTACGNDAATDANQNTTKTDTAEAPAATENSDADKTVETTDAQPAKASAEENKKLTVYTYDSFTSEWGPAPQLEKAFEAQCGGCDVDFVAFDDGVTMYNRLRLEGDKPKADVIVGLDNNLLKSAEESGLFAKTSIDTSQFKLPIEWTSQTFIPYDYGQYAFIYDKNKLAKPPTSLKALVENQDLSIIYQDPRTSTVGRGLLAWVNEVYGDESESAWKKLAQHTVTVGKGWTETYGAFLKGESDVVLSYSTSPLYHQINEKKENYVAATFDEGHIVQIEVASVLKATDSPKLAEDFVKFLISPESQKTLALTNIMLPVIDTDVEPRFDSFTPAKTLLVPQPTEEASKAQIDVWQSAVSK